MTTGNTSYPVNTLSFLSEEMERTLRLRAWKDEIFREALIADPKGVIQRLFPQCFPNGKLPEELTLKVIEEDPDICHIVVPFLPDEFPTHEIPEEEQLELLACMGVVERSRDSSENRESRSSEKTKPNFTKQEYMRKQAQEATKRQDAASEPLTRDKIANLADKDEKFRKKLLDVSKEASSETKQEMLIKTLQEYFPHHFDGSNAPEGQTFKVTQDTSETRHLVFPKLPDTSLDTTLPKYEQQNPESGEQTCKAVSC
jgi:hypothetical protein